MIPPHGVRRPICMIVHAYYEEDSRVRREAETLVAQGRPVDVFALRRPGAERLATLDGVRVHRLDVQRHQGAGLGTYLLEYLAFLVRASWAATRSHRRRRYGLVHIHSLPDFLVFAGLPLRLMGVPIVLDLHEAMPEFFRMRFPRASQPVFQRLLLWQERLSIGLASAVITVNDALADRLVRLGVRRDKVTVIMNSPSRARFDPAAYPAREFRADGLLRMVYAGALTPIYELDVVVAAMARLRALRPDLRALLDVYGRGDARDELEALVAELGLSDSVTFHGRIPLEDVPAAIARADLGIAPTRRDRFTDLSLSTKIFECAAMAKPIVASRLPMVERVFPPGAIRCYEPGDPDDLARVILAVIDDSEGRIDATRQASVAVGEHSWEREAERLVALVDRVAMADSVSSPS